VTAVRTSNFTGTFILNFIFVTCFDIDFWK
jgi:hypothetical protein